MRITVPLIAIALTTGAAAEPARAPQAAPVELAPEAMAAQADARAVCRDRIHEVSQQGDLPAIQRDTANPDEPLHIAAVDRRMDGCSYMVMRGNLADVRALPVAPGEPRFQRIPRQSQ